jgi:hypothetical protein
MQEELKQRVKAWLKSSGRTREWLAERCDAKLKTVNNWLSSSRPIPSKALIIINQLMESVSVGPEEPAQGDAPDDRLVLKVSEARYDAYSRAALHDGLPLKEWAIEALDEAARDELANPQPEADQGGEPGSALGTATVATPGKSYPSGPAAEAV